MHPEHTLKRSWYHTNSAANATAKNGALANSFTHPIVLGPVTPKVDFRRLDATEISLPSLKTLDLVDDLIEERMRDAWTQQQITALQQT